MEKYGDGKLRSREPDRLSPELLQSRMMPRSFSAGSGCSNLLAEYASAISLRTAEEAGLASIVNLFFLHAFISSSKGQAEGIANLRTQVTAALPVNIYVRAPIPPRIAVLDGFTRQRNRQPQSSD